MESDLEAYRVWYPPMRSSLLCLSKLYGCVDPKIFNGLAQDAVHAATVCVQVSILPTTIAALCLFPSCVNSLDRYLSTEPHGRQVNACVSAETAPGV